MSIRKERLADEIRDIVGSACSGGQLSDPRLGGVSITAVKLSPDLQIATVYFRNFDDKIQVDDVKRGLESASGVFRKKLAEVLDVRRMPNLRFFFDESLERASRIENLLKQTRTE